MASRTLGVEELLDQKPSTVEREIFHQNITSGDSILNPDKDVTVTSIGIHMKTVNTLCQETTNCQCEQHFT